MLRVGRGQLNVSSMQLSCAFGVLCFAGSEVSEEGLWKLRQACASTAGGKEVGSNTMRCVAATNEEGREGPRMAAYLHLEYATGRALIGKADKWHHPLSHKGARCTCPVVNILQPPPGHLAVAPPQLSVLEGPLAPIALEVSAAAETRSGRRYVAMTQIRTQYPITGHLERSLSLLILTNVLVSFPVILLSYPVAGRKITIAAADVGLRG